jgi:hypothetical protein
MYRKLMFLISLVALLSWAGAARADDIVWDGEVDLSWHTLGNWVGDVLPGTEDRAVVVVPGTWNPVTDPCYLGPVITSNVTVMEFRGPAWEQSDVNQVMTIDGATLNVTSGDGEAWNRDRDFRGIWIVDLKNGGAINMTGGIRWPDHGTFIINIPSGTSVTTGDQWRGADEGDGFWIMNLTGGSINVGDQIQIGDNGQGEHNLNSGTVQCNEYLMIAREKTTTVNVAGATVNVNTDFILNDDDNGDAILDVTAGSLTVGGELRCGQASGLGKLLVSGGSVTAGQIRVPHSDNADGRLTQTGGTIECGTLYVRDNGIVKLDGGTCTVTGASLDLQSGAVVNIETGTLKLAGDKTAQVDQYVAEGKLGGYYVGAPFNTFRGGIARSFDGTWTTVTATPPNWTQAWGPDPLDGTTKIGQSGATLSWQPGNQVGGDGYHDVYFGTTYAAVDTANPMSDEFQAHQAAGDRDWDTGAMDNWKTYYWRIDELDKWNIPEKGLVWSFTTGCEDIPGDQNADCVLDFKDFADVADTWGEEAFYPDDF